MSLKDRIDASVINIALHPERQGPFAISKEKINQTMATVSITAIDEKIAELQGQIDRLKKFKRKRQTRKANAQ